MPHELHRDGYTVSDNPARLDLTAVHAFLSRSYWARNVPLEMVRRSAQHSLNFGVYVPDGAQVGYARAITDYTTFAYLCDVYILEAHRGRGLSKALMEAIVSHPQLQDLRRFNLVTQDAHGLYTPFGFTPVKQPERYMEKLDPSAIQRWIERSGRAS